jgi:hypothetical protein
VFLAALRHPGALDGPAIRYLTPDHCAQPGVSDWVEANWLEVVKIIGRERAAEVARDILVAREAEEGGPLLVQHAVERQRG